MQQQRIELPGSKGGATTAARYGAEYMRAIGSKGGVTTAARYRDSRSLLGKLGAAARWYRPRSLATFDGLVRRLAWWPAGRGQSRRRRPILVYIEQEG